ncbi:MAG: hypothetical protein P4M11_08410 [Candidatus Pacebacteria bacterium]|nr:hypothetical protein [Candidatus Paceibacterota bacterium]
MIWKVGRTKRGVIQMVTYIIRTMKMMTPQRWDQTFMVSLCSIKRLLTTAFTELKLIL